MPEQTAPLSAPLTSLLKADAANVRDLQLLQKAHDEVTPDMLASRSDLVESIRSLINALAVARLERNDIAAAKEVLEDLTGRLRQAPRLPGLTRAIEGRLTGLGPHGELGPFTGSLHTFSPGMEIEVTGEGSARAVTARALYGDAYEGVQGLLQGGFIVATFDEILGLVQCGSRRVTASLEISYRAPTPLHQPLVYRSWTDRIEGRKAFVAGELRCGETLCAEAKALFIQPRTE